MVADNAMYLTQKYLTIYTKEVPVLQFHIDVKGSRIFSNHGAIVVGMIVQILERGIRDMYSYKWSWKIIYYISKEYTFFAMLDVVSLGAFGGFWINLIEAIHTFFQNQRCLGHI